MRFRRLKDFWLLLPMERGGKIDAEFCLRCIEVNFSVISNFTG